MNTDFWIIEPDVGLSIIDFIILASLAAAVGLATVHYHTVDNGIVALSRSLMATAHRDVLSKAV